VLDNRRNEDYNGHKRLKNHQIRLVKIQPDLVKFDHSSSEEDAIQCTLLDVDLSSIGKYTALSYCWGGFDPGIKILLNGEVYEVTENLHCALETFRQSNGDALFFIDALCINQNDDAEKSAQVQSMWEVYKKATQVVVFLGGPQKHVVNAFEWIKTAGEELKSFRYSIIQGAAGRTSLPSLEDQNSIYDGLQHIMSRPWWRYVTPLLHK
jgi:hypothetical protein